ncbi:MAG: right-handed parallel beta-helix repeat-containing protein, partial [Euryarchaeota archaeon]|nr:right-handed parallel beta-helix repeat-containing protein [Euryarchaeota archaeon]
MNRPSHALRAFIAVASLLVLTTTPFFTAAEGAAARVEPAPMPAPAAPTANRSVLTFDDADGQFRVQARGFEARLVPGHVELAFPSGAVRMEFVGGHEVAPKGTTRLGASFARVRYADVYPGIDAEFYGRNGLLEYDFVVKPGADARLPAVRFTGADLVELTPAGRVTVHQGDDVFTVDAPVSYQSGPYRPVASRFVARDDGSIGFWVGDYDHARRLVIDPVFLVDSTGDESDMTPGDGTCATASATCTLRAAIESANLSPEIDSVRFDLAPGSVIQPASSALPTIMSDIEIDGTTMAGWTGSPLVVLDGSFAPPGSDGLYVVGAYLYLHALVIQNFSGNGVHLEDTPEAAIFGNHIGVGIDGSTPQGNAGDGIHLTNTTSTQIGGTSVNDRNVIGANGGNGIFQDTGYYTTILNNHIGVNAEGYSGADGLVGWYQGEGDATDALGVHDGANNGATFVSGVVGQAMSFDGVDDEVGLGTWFDLQEFTLEMWVNPADGSTQNAFANILDNAHTDARSWVIQYDNVGNQYHFGAAGGGDVGLHFTLTPGAWQHLAITVDADHVMRAYLDGLLIDTAPLAGPITYDGTQSLSISKWGSGGGRQWEGRLDELGVYDRALSAQEIRTIRALYSTGKSLHVGNALSGVDVFEAASVVLGESSSGNVISSNGLYGVIVDGAGTAGTTIRANKIGMDATGFFSYGNAQGGIWAIGTNGLAIGGTFEGEGNVVSANGPEVSGHGIELYAAMNPSIEWNRIGVSAAGLDQFGNGGDGLRLAGGTSGATVRSNVIGGNAGNGISVHGEGDAFATGNLIEGNYIGVGADHFTPLGNGAWGMDFFSAPDNSVGGNDESNANVIVDNGEGGIRLADSWSSGNWIIGNRIGMDLFLTSAIPNHGPGVWLDGGAQYNHVGGFMWGQENTIAYNEGAGILVTSDAANNNAFISNSIFLNGGLGIDLSSSGLTEDGSGVNANDPLDEDAGANGGLNHPIVTRAYVDDFSGMQRVVGYVSSTPSPAEGPWQQFTVQIFASDTCDPSGHGEGWRHIGDAFTTTGEDGVGVFDLTPWEAFFSSGEFITATATRYDDNLGEVETSEFSACEQAGGLLPIVVNSVGDGTDFDGSDGACETIDGDCSLRAALDEASQRFGPDTIAFDIPGPG